MSADTQALWDAMVRDYAPAGREVGFQRRLAEIMSQYAAEIDQRGLWERAA